MRRIRFCRHEGHTKLPRLRNAHVISPPRSSAAFVWAILLFYSLTHVHPHLSHRYTVICTILLGNLLIAIITNRYKPEKVKEQAALNMAESELAPRAAACMRHLCS